MGGFTGFTAGGMVQGMGQGRQMVLDIAHQRLLEKQQKMMEAFRLAQEERFAEQSRHSEEQDIVAPWKGIVAQNPEALPGYIEAGRFARAMARGSPESFEYQPPPRIDPTGAPGIDLSPPTARGEAGYAQLGQDVSEQIRRRRVEDIQTAAENKLNIQTAGKEQDYNKELMKKLLELQKAMLTGELRISSKADDIAVRKQLELYMKVISSGVPLSPDQYARMASGIDAIAARYGRIGIMKPPGMPEQSVPGDGNMPPPPPTIPSKPAASETEHIRAIRDALSHSRSLVQMIEQKKLPNYTTLGSGRLGSILNAIGQPIGIDDPQVSEFRKWLTQNFLGRLRAIGGARAVNKFDIQNLISSFENPNIQPKTLEALARGSVATLEKELNDAMRIYQTQGKNIPTIPEELISPEGILGKKPMPPGGIPIPNIRPP